MVVKKLPTCARALYLISLTRLQTEVKFGPLQTSDRPPIDECNHSDNLILNDGTPIIVSTCSREVATVSHVAPVIVVSSGRDETTSGGRKEAGRRKDLSSPPALPPSNYEIPQAWAEFLDNPSLHWAWYGHFTFKDYPHPESAEKSWDMLIHKLNRASFGSRYYKDKSKGVVWARSTELQKRGAIHYHALIGNVPAGIRRFKFMDEWYKQSGIGRIFAYEKDQGAEFYMSKSTYAWKRGEIDLSDTVKYHIDEMVLPQVLR